MATKVDILNSFGELLTNTGLFKKVVRGLKALEDINPNLTPLAMYNSERILIKDILLPRTLVKDLYIDLYVVNYVKSPNISDYMNSLDTLEEEVINAVLCANYEQYGIENIELVDSNELINDDYLTGGLYVILFNFKITYR